MHTKIASIEKRILLLVLSILLLFGQSKPISITKSSFRF